MLDDTPGGTRTAHFSLTVRNSENSSYLVSVPSFSKSAPLKVAYYLVPDRIEILQGNYYNTENGRPKSFDKL